MTPDPPDPQRDDPGEGECRGKPPEDTALTYGCQSTR